MIDGDGTRVAVGYYEVGFAVAVEVGVTEILRAQPGRNSCLRRKGRWDELTVVGEGRVERRKRNRGKAAGGDCYLLGANAGRHSNGQGIGGSSGNGYPNRSKPNDIGGGGGAEIVTGDRNRCIDGT